ncbi:MAG: integrin alpha, partial [Bacteroidota bacterium]
MNSAAIFRTFLALVAVFCLDGAFRCVMAQASCLAVDSAQKVSDTQGNFTGTLAASDQFGRGATAVGDIDGDGIVDLAVGAYFGGGNDEGAVWVLFMTANGTVSSQQAIGAGLGGFTGSLDFDDQFGVSVCPLGDLNGDGVPDIAVGANQDDDGGLDRGAVWILFLNANGTVNAQQKISDLQGNFTGTLANNDLFGIALDSIGDVNNDGVNDLAVGAMFDDDGQVNAGAVWVLFLNANGTVDGQQNISSTQCGFGGALDTGDRFGVTV